MKKMKRGRMMSGIGLVASVAAGFGCASSEPLVVAQADVQQEEMQYEAAPLELERASFVGEAGPEGPAGPAGARGERGETGELGVVAVGPRGAPGPVGPTGVRGPTGASGAEGAIAVGGAGVRGPSGPAGAQGDRGLAGVQGGSGAGLAGPAGPSGPQGEQGPAGLTGERGATLTGPSGPAGRGGVAGGQGESGTIGIQGDLRAGVAGPAGIPGPAGLQGPSGSTGPQGITGVIENWTSYREFWFEQDEAGLHSSDAAKIAEIAAYMRQNGSLQVGIDGSTDPNGREPLNPDLRDQRISSVRSALIRAGIKSETINVGSLGDPRTRRDRRVEVLIRTRQQ